MIDLTGKKSGRGAYLCGKVDCFRLAKKSRALDRALKHAVSQEIYDQLERDFILVKDEYLSGRNEDVDEP